MDEVIQALKAAKVWEKQAVFVAYTDSIFIYKAALEDGSFWGVEIINEDATLLSEMLVSELVSEYGNVYISVQHFNSDGESLSNAITYNEIDNEPMDIENAMMPLRNKLSKDKDGVYYCQILDMELDPIKCTFNGDSCVTIDAQDLSYIVLSRENLKVLHHLIGFAE